MTEDQHASEEAVQAVVNRVSAHRGDDSVATVEQKLVAGFEHAGVTVSSTDIVALAVALDANAGDLDPDEVVD